VSVQLLHVVELPSFPVYCCDLVGSGGLVAVGGSNPSFIGVPVQLVDISSHSQYV
jgi:hypothetical protein